MPPPRPVRPLETHALHGRGPGEEPRVRAGDAPPRGVDALSDSLDLVSIGRSAAGDDMLKFWMDLGCDRTTARRRLREDAWLLHFEGPRKLRETALATVPAKRRGRGRFWVDMTTGARVYPLKQVPEAVKRLRQMWSQTPPEWERLPDAATVAFNLDASLYVAKRKGASRMVGMGATFGASVRATLKPLPKPPWRCLTRECRGVVARRVGRRAREQRLARDGRQQRVVHAEHLREVQQAVRTTTAGTLGMMQPSSPAMIVRLTPRAAS